MANGTNNRRAGRIYVKVDGQQYDAKGDFTYNLGADKRDAIVGADGIHGYKETPQIPFIEGAFTDAPDLDLQKLAEGDNLTVTLELVNGKTIVLSNAWFAGEGGVTTGEGEISVRFESRKPAQEQK
ncbi:phage tail tube protein [uncultured Desulfovibrio sp.]|uniref:phage tail tube protein n=1 Tax=uncultured Desulfovibrio sp. TaxID=167968 RepID=UPI0026251AB7|nr:phage tail tube protein [uncultured Desulfovibrio sp.]